MLFQHTAARRRLVAPYGVAVLFLPVSTHSRPKAAGGRNAQHYKGNRFQHTAARRRLAASRTIFGWFTKFQHTAARRRLEWGNTASDAQHIVSTHSRPKAAGCSMCLISSPVRMFQHTAARRRLAKHRLFNNLLHLFQHTAARRRLAILQNMALHQTLVSTHSRPKAAGSTAF